jgi:hypothetical protein
MKIGGYGKRAARIRPNKMFFGEFFSDKKGL